jgi:hemolysin III
MKRLKFTIIIKDPISTITHLMGGFMALIALGFMLYEAAQSDSALNIIAALIFGGTMVGAYSASTVYHWLPLTVKGEKFFRKIDQSAIYCLIAGTYTPICLVALTPEWGWSLLAFIWFLSLFGVAMLWSNKRRRGYYRWLHTYLYLGMGWVSLIAIYPIAQALSGEAIAWLVAGGAAYSVGAFIYGHKKPDPWPHVFGYHEIFHLFVMLGSFCHFWLVYRFILPPGS